MGARWQALRFELRASPAAAACLKRPARSAAAVTVCQCQVCAAGGGGGMQSGLGSELGRDRSLPRAPPPPRDLTDDQWTEPGMSVSLARPT